MKGFVSQVISIVGLIAGLLVARALFGVVGERLATEIGTSVTVGQILAFILIGIIVPLGLSIAASLLTKVLNVISLGCINRWLGSGVGLIKYALLVSMAIRLIQFIDADNTLMQSTMRPLSAYPQILGPLLSDVYTSELSTPVCYSDLDSNSAKLICLQILANGKLITKVASASAEDVDLAAKAADAAFKTSWGTKVPGYERGRFLSKLADVIDKHVDELAAVEAVDCGTHRRSR